VIRQIAPLGKSVWTAADSILSAWFGAGSALKERAWTKASAMVT